MKFIILSGGAGKRLWPFSTDEKPKHLLKVLKNGNDSESMLQRIVRQILHYVKPEDIIITTTKQQLGELENQVKGINIICEPEIRDTFPAIMLAVSFLYDRLKCKAEEIVAVISADSFVEDAFWSKLFELKDAVFQYEAPLGIIGIKPHNPSTRFGYIDYNNNNNESIFFVKNFIEKPNKELAQKLILKGALWNSGVFVFPLSTVLNEMRNENASINYDLVQSNFKNFDKVSFDYAVVEKINNIICIQYDGKWEDLGSWQTLVNYLDKNTKNVEMTEDCSNVEVINKINIPVKILGLSDITVVLTEKGILISNTQDCDRLKELS